MNETRQRYSALAVVGFFVSVVLVFIPFIGLMLSLSGLIAIRRHNLKGRFFAYGGIVIDFLKILFIMLVLSGFVPFESWQQAFEEGRQDARVVIAKSRLDQIVDLQNKYKEINGAYLACPPNPPKVPGGEPQLWQEGKEYQPWNALGFKTLSDRVHFQYEVKLKGEDSFYAIARSDLNGDGEEEIIAKDPQKQIIKNSYEEDLE